LRSPEASLVGFESLFQKDNLVVRAFATADMLVASSDVGVDVPEDNAAPSSGSVCWASLNDDGDLGRLKSSGI
jgi:hypothetical protein